jgi:hypothetical protein
MINEVRLPPNTVTTGSSTPPMPVVNTGATVVDLSQTMTMQVGAHAPAKSIKAWAVMRGDTFLSAYEFRDTADEANLFYRGKTSIVSVTITIDEVA